MFLLKKTIDQDSGSRLPSPGFRFPSSDAAFTLMELMITIVILGFSSLILIPYFNAVTHGPEPMIRQRAISLGQALMDEITAKKWDELSPNGGGPIDTLQESSGRGLAVSASAIGLDGLELAADRSNWDDVDDYNGYSETDGFTDQNNTAFTLPGYSRQVSVSYIPSNSDPISAVDPLGSPLAADSTDTKRIVVQVTSPRQETFTFVAVVCNF